MVEPLDSRAAEPEASGEAADFGVLLQDGRTNPLPGQLITRCQARKASADDDDMGSVSGQC